MLSSGRERSTQIGFEGEIMMSKTIGAIFAMVIAAIVGFFIGAALNDIVGGMILMVLISGIAYIVHAIETSNKSE